MSTMPLPCLLCLFISTDTLLLERDVTAVKDGPNISSERFLKSFVVLSTKLHHRGLFLLVNFALGCQHVLHRL